MKKKLFLSAALCLPLCVNTLFAETPATLSIKGTAVAEATGDQQALPMKLTDNVFEIYTSLQTGNYSFDGDATIAEQSITADAATPYRIRVDYSTGTPAVTAEKIVRVYLWAPYDQFTIGELTYRGGSVFHGDLFYYTKGRWGDDRYRIRIEFEGGRYETYGNNNSMELTRATNGQWTADENGGDQSYKVKGGCLQGEPFDVDVILKADGVYTHELTQRSLAVQGTALAEVESTETMPMKWTGNYFELYTSLQSGEYSFVGDASIGAQSVTVDTPAPYRIRVDYSGETPAVTAQQVEKVYMWAPYSHNTLAELPYVGNSVFRAENIICEDGDAWFNQTNWTERRYRIRIQFAGDVLETYAPKDGENFVSVGNDDWGDSDHNYELSDRYRNEHQPFTAIVNLSTESGFMHELIDYVFVPELLSVQGTALAEADNAAMPMTKVGDAFELYTTLQSGSYTFTEEGLAEQTIEVAESAPYRIRVDYTTEPPVITTQKIEKVYMWAPYSHNTLVELPYVGNSVFRAENIVCEDGDAWFGKADWGEKRYRIRILFEGDVLETYAPKGGENFVLIGNGDWGGENEYQYELADRYRNDHQPFTATVTLSATEGYSHSIEDYTDAPTTGIATSESMTASIYPTVVSDYLTVQADSEDFTVELYSISGAKLLMQEHCSQEAILGTSELANGIYLVKVSQAGTLIQLQKVVKK